MYVASLRAGPASGALATLVEKDSTWAVTMRVGGFRVSELRFGRVHLPSHYHERACLSVVFDGGFTEVFPGRVLECKAGFALVKPPGERHTDIMTGSRQVVVEPEVFDAVDETTQALFSEIRIENSQLAAAIAERLSNELHARDAWSVVGVEGLTLELLAAVGRRSQSTDRQPPQWLQRVRDRVCANQTPPRIAELATLAGVHPVYLNRTFRKHFGLSIAAFGRRTRLEWAARQLATTAEPLARISIRAGFADQSHFTRAFKTFAGVTPGEYRTATGGSRSRP